MNLKCPHFPVLLSTDHASREARCLGMGWQEQIHHHIDVPSLKTCWLKWTPAISLFQPSMSHFFPVYFRGPLPLPPNKQKEGLGFFAVALGHGTSGAACLSQKSGAWGKGLHPLLVSVYLQCKQLLCRSFEEAPHICMSRSLHALCGFPTWSELFREESLLLCLHPREDGEGQSDAEPQWGVMPSAKEVWAELPCLW